MDYLEEHTSEYEQVLCTDTRDVIFQDDVFKYFTKYDHYLGNTFEADDIRGSKTGKVANYVWITNAFGKIEADKLADKPIICCGTVIGTPAEIKIYTEKIWEYMGNRNFHGLDQATHQYLFYNNLLPIENFIGSDVETGAIFTAGIFKNPKIVDEKILRGDGGVPAVVHQYNWHAGLVQLVDNLYREKDFQPDENFRDFQSALDQVFCLVQRQNFGAATKFFINYVAYAENLNSYGEQFLKLAQLILQHYNPDAEILLSAVQKTLILNANINIQQMEEIYKVFITSEKNLHCVNPSFKNFIKNMLFAFTDIFYKNNRQDLGRQYLKLLSDWRD